MGTFCATVSFRPTWRSRSSGTSYPGRFRAALTELGGFGAHAREPDPPATGHDRAAPRRAAQDETFVPLHGTLTMYLGEPPERHEVPVGGIVHVEAGTIAQIVNETDDELVVFVYGAPPERAGADILDSAV